MVVIPSFNLRKFQESNWSLATNELKWKNAKYLIINSVDIQSSFPATLDGAR